MKHQNARWSEKVKYKQPMWKQIAKVLIAVLWRYAFFYALYSFLYLCLLLSRILAMRKNTYTRTRIRVNNRRTCVLLWKSKTKCKHECEVHKSSTGSKQELLTPWWQRVCGYYRVGRQLYKLYQCKGSHYVYMNYLWYLNTIFNSTKTRAGARKREKKRVKLVLML